MVLPRVWGDIKAKTLMIKTLVGPHHAILNTRLSRIINELLLGLAASFLFDLKIHISAPDTYFVMKFGAQLEETLIFTYKPSK